MRQNYVLLSAASFVFLPAAAGAGSISRYLLLTAEWAGGSEVAVPACHVPLVFFSIEAVTSLAGCDYRSFYADLLSILTCPGRVEVSVFS